VPPITGAVGDARGMGLAMLIPLLFFVLAWSYALAVNFVPKYKSIADAFTKTEIGIQPMAAEEERPNTQGVESVDDKNARATIE
jgi:MFS transporter, FHS family, L-fucose permease